MTKEIKDVAMWEENDSELAKYHIQQLLKTYNDLEEQYKSLMKKAIEQDKRIKQAFDYCEEIINQAIDTTDSDYDLGRDFTARDILYILSPKMEGDENE